MSKKFSLDSQDAKNILRNIAIIYSPVLLLGLDQLQAGTFDYKILYALAISVTIDVIRRYVKNNIPSKK